MEPKNPVEDVLHARDLDRRQKIQRLRQMSYDAERAETAAGEGMLGPPIQPTLSRIREALRSLGATADEADTGPGQP